MVCAKRVDVIIRPGPPSIAPLSAPGGLVVHVYTAERHPQLVHTGTIDNESEAFLTGEQAAAIVLRLGGHGAQVIIVVYDGDTGERLLRNMRTSCSSISMAPTTDTSTLYDEDDVGSGRFCSSTCSSDRTTFAPVDGCSSPSQRSERRSAPLR